MAKPSPETLKEYRWKNRIVHLAAPSSNDSTYQAQAAALLTGFEGLLERDIVVLTDFTSAHFELNLIGKDGGIKLSRRTLLATEELFAIIDAMPMRLDEMRRETDSNHP